MDFEKNIPHIREKLSLMKKIGFDRIHIPGGTSKDKDYYAGVVPYHYDQETKQMFFLGLPYDSKYHESGDENGHTKKRDETPVSTAVRELMEETALQVVKDEMEFLYMNEIKDRYVPGKFFKRNYFCCDISESNGSIFTFEGRNPIDGETGAPIWIPAKIAKETFFWGHHKALEETAKKLMEANSDFAFALMNM